MALTGGSAKNDKAPAAGLREKVSPRLAARSTTLLRQIQPAFRMPQVRRLLDSWRFAPLRKREVFRELRRSVAMSTRI